MITSNEPWSVCENKVIDKKLKMFSNSIATERNRNDNVANIICSVIALMQLTISTLFEKIHTALYVLVNKI